MLARRRRDDPLALLTPREREVLQLMATGSSNQGTADAMVIIVRAVEKYSCSMFDRLGIPGSAGESRPVFAVLLFLRS
jgi:DNA-binding NarL/FixJ family response regulator